MLVYYIRCFYEEDDIWYYIGNGAWSRNRKKMELYTGYLDLLESLNGLRERHNNLTIAPIPMFADTYEEAVDKALTGFK